MVRDIEDEIRVEKNHPQLDEASLEDEIIIVEKNQPQLDEVSIVDLLDSPYSLDESVEEIDSVSEKLNEHCNVYCDDDFESALNIFPYVHVPPKKRNFWNYEFCRRSSELSTACILCDLADDSVVPCSGKDCPLAVHKRCAELDCKEDPAASSYCPYCWLKYQATSSMAVAAAKAHEHSSARMFGTELNSGDIAVARENVQGSDKTLPMQLHENLHQIRKAVEQLKSLNLQLDKSADQVIDMEESSGEASVVVNDQPKRVLWTVEEETMLMVGVEKYSKIINKNMPWKKILEMGEGVFHVNRSSSDLKDKWRNMVRMSRY
ncbi:PREDICTED: uncharacterized protein LOC104754259 [Camelina sativa]|uniref:Uncharacterized protein LOC104754259 n=1 Tax=Camelina sativa TaxID=90675 RepID=A0ABM1R5B2_CAMSA|nr:PREDICTED: uncharacterized protein LOC104754259 [Camelina sativa]